MLQPYEPIACALHDEYEIAIMHKRKLSIKWLDNNTVFTGIVLPVDILVRNGEEFLVASLLSESKDVCIRLDKITLIE